MGTYIAKTLLLSLLLLCTASAWCKGEEQRFQFRHITVSEGLPSNTVRAITQDEEGYIWMGTDEGLCRYDGLRIRQHIFDHEKHDNFVGALHCQGCRVWVGTYQGILMFDTRTEQFTKLETKTEKGISIQALIQAIEEDHEGNLWIATRGQGVFKYNTKRDYLEQYPLTKIKGMTSSVLVDSDNQVWVTSNWNTPSLWRLNKARNVFAPISLKQGADREHTALCLYEDSQKDLWLGTWERGLWRIHPDGRYDVFATHATHIHDIEEYEPGMLLIGSDDGLVLLNTKTGHTQTYIEDDSRLNAISSRFVYPVYKDREGGVWIGTFYGGVNYIAPNAGSFAQYTHSRFHNSVGGNIINRFCEDEAGNVWIASDDGGLSCLSAHTGLFANYLPRQGANSLSYHNVHALCIDGDRLWIGTYTGGINVLDTRTAQFTHHDFRQGLSTGNSRKASSYAIFKDSRGTIWAGSMDNVTRYNPATGEFEEVGKLNALTIDIDEDAQGNLWFSTQGNGLFRYHPQTSKWTHYPQGTKEGDLPHSQVNCAYVDSRRQLWIGTSAGLCRFVPQGNGSFERVPLDIPSQMIFGIVEQDHVYWLATGKGLVRWEPGGECQVYTRRDGLLSDLFLPNAMMKASDGRIFVGCESGFNAFYPHQVRANRIAPPVRITGLEIYNQAIAVGSKVLPTSLRDIGELHLSHDQRMFSLQFAALSYCVPEKNKYAYMLEGFDKAWNQVGSQHTATYTNLPAGTYTFRVKAANNDGVWCDKEARLTIVVHPPFYWSLPAKILYLLLFLLTIYLLVRYFLYRKERQHKAAIRRLNAKKEKEIHRAKISFFTMVAHEIRTPVSLIIGPLEKVMKTDAAIPGVMRDELNIIDRNAHRLLYLVNQLLDFRKIEEKSLVMKFSPHNIKQLMHAVDERFAPTFKQQGIQFQVVYPDDNFTAIVDSEAITKVISNLLTNSRKYTKDWVEMKCHYEPDGDTFSISVADNGIGISEDDLPKVFQPFFQAKENKPGTGIGLNIVKNIVDLHQGRIDVKSQLGQGTCFTVTLPVKQEHVSIEESADTIATKAAATPRPANTDTSEPKKRDTMLVVDDNEDMVNFIAENFRSQYHVLTAADGIEALNHLKQHTVQLIVSDWMMPRMDGEELCRKVRQDANTSHIPFVLLTAKTDNEAKVQGMDCGADAYIEKPFSVAYLEACIKNMLHMRQLLREKFSTQPLEPISHIAATPVDSDLLEHMRKIIEDNFSNPEFSVNTLADQLCMSRSALFAKIKALADITPNEMIQLTRLKKAASLLATGQYQVSEVCYMVGFSNPSYFSKCFLKQFGIKPSDFMQQQ